VFSPGHSTTNLLDQVYSLMFVKDGKIIILFENDHQHDAEEEKENKIQGLSKKFLLLKLAHQIVGK
jgi:hypothetical protein